MRAATMMADMGVGCLITLGGDGTNRAVAAATNQIPLVAISTGTNNIFPVMVEGTLAGIAAGLVASGRLELADTSVTSKTLQIRVNGEPRDLALVDVAISRERYVATRAIWDLDTVHEVFLTRAEPAGIGLSSVGGRLHPLSIADVGGLHYKLARGNPATNAPATTVLAPVAPGIVEPAVIAEWELLQEGVPVALEPRYCTRRPGRRAFPGADARRLCGDTAGAGRPAGSPGAAHPAPRRPAGPVSSGLTPPRAAGRLPPDANRTGAGHRPGRRVLRFGRAGNHRLRAGHGGNARPAGDTGAPGCRRDSQRHDCADRRD